MIAIPIKFVEKVILSLKKEIDEIIEERKSKITTLLNNKNQSFSISEREYLQNLHKNLKEIVIGKPNQLKYLKNNYFNPIKITKRRKLSDEERITKQHQINFRDLILSVLNYDKLRSSFYPKYFKRIGIKACVYCNSQLAITSDNKNNIKAKFQVDHYLPKSEYPCFSISFYNLYPVCTSCNNAKGDKYIEFELFSDDKRKINKSKFNFFLEKGSVAKFLISRDYNDLKFEFKEPSENKQFQQTFDIQGIYETQKDIIEELILKKEIYTNSYKKTLKVSFPKLLYNSISLSNRIIIGNYSFEYDIHKRPMAKFTQDIAKQLNLID